MANNDYPTNSGPLSKDEMTNIAPTPTNSGVRPEELVSGEVRPGEPNWSDLPSFAETRGSGTDKNSDSRRLSDPENLQDKAIEDTFPASDPPSTSMITGVGNPHDQTYSISGLPEDFKDNPSAQFDYGRRSQKATEHFDRASRRLDTGNPDIGEVDLGTIEADKPAQPDDHDHFDSADDRDDQTEREF